LLGPGFGVTQNRELEPGWVDAHLAEHPRLIVADFSSAILHDAYQSLLSASPRMKAENMRLVRRDCSGGLSTRFEALVGSKLDGIETVGDFREFMRWLDETVDSELVIRQEVESGPTYEGRLDVRGTDPQQLLCFKNLVQDTADVRFLIANGVFSGAFYLTEAAFRDKLMYFAKQYPQQVTAEDVRVYMHIWHEVISDMINCVMVESLRSFTEEHPQAQAFVTLDKSAAYEEMDDFPRLNIEYIRRQLADCLSLRVAHTWMLDDSGQVPPHTHSVAAIWVSPVHYDDGSKGLPQIPLPPEAV
jgi:hypothetical protein